MKFNVNVELEIEDVLEGILALHHTNIRQFILNLDKLVADCDFTEDLILSLINAMEEEEKDFLERFLTEKFPDTLELQKKIVFKKEDFDL